MNPHNFVIQNDPGGVFQQFKNIIAEHMVAMSNCRLEHILPGGDWKTAAACRRNDTATGQPTAVSLFLAYVRQKIVTFASLDETNFGRIQHALEAVRDYATLQTIGDMWIDFVVVPGSRSKKRFISFFG
jgi:hypothetical protein